MEVVPDSQWTYWQLHHCLLADLSGYNQHDPRVSDYLIGAGKKWLDNGVDDFRLDAIKFPFPDFVAKFTHSMIDYSMGLGRPARPRISPPPRCGKVKHAGRSQRIFISIGLSLSPRRD